MSKETDDVRALITALQAKVATDAQQALDFAHSVRILTDSLRHPRTGQSDGAK